jgi:hypothetical protein
MENKYLALDTSLNRIVRFQIVPDPNLEHVLERLPADVSTGLAAELRVSDEAHRYDLQAQCAYYFRSAGNALLIWIWQEVETYEEAARLLTLIVDLKGELGEETASDLYRRATGRSANQPRSDYPAS